MFLGHIPGSAGLFGLVARCSLNRSIGLLSPSSCSIWLPFVSGSVTNWEKILEIRSLLLGSNYVCRHVRVLNEIDFLANFLSNKNIFCVRAHLVSEKVFCQIFYVKSPQNDSRLIF